MFGEGISKAKSRMDAARKSYRVLLEDGYIINIYKEAVGEADEYESESLRQINELVQKGLISKPKYVLNRSMMKKEIRFGHAPAL